MFDSGMTHECLNTFGSSLCKSSMVTTGVEDDTTVNGWDSCFSHLLFTGHQRLDVDQLEEKWNRPAAHDRR